jgi:hypothetical protein
MMRVHALKKVNGYRGDMIAGEEPELCFRLRTEGGLIWRLEAEMTLHDAAIHRFDQWWKRNVRSGHAYAEVAFLHGATIEQRGVKESRSALIWGLILPLTIIVCAMVIGLLGLAGFMIYPLQIVRLAWRGKRTIRENWWRAVFLILGKFPEMIGQLKFAVHRYSGTHARLIEYK